MTAMAASLRRLVAIVGPAGAVGLALSCQEPAPADEKIPPIIDAGRTPGRDAGKDAADGGTSDGGVTSASTICPAAPPSTTPTFVPPPLRGTPCTADDVQAYLGNEGRSFDEQRDAMIARNPLCAGCVFTRETDTNWGPVVQTNDGRIYWSFGHCYAAAGASSACAEAGHAYEWCHQKVCNVCIAPSGQTSQSKDDCSAAQQTGDGPCRELFDAAVSACAPFASDLQVPCLRSGGVVNTLCGPL